jgi:fructose-1,6-bisphosphatase
MQLSPKQHAMSMLFSAKWNIPQAAAEMGFDSNQENWEQVKEEFVQYCKEHPTTWVSSS